MPASYAGLLLLSNNYCNYSCRYCCCCCSTTTTAAAAAAAAATTTTTTTAAAAREVAFKVYTLDAAIIRQLIY